MTPDGMTYDQHNPGDEYVTHRGIICNELCYGCSTERFAVAVRAAVCIVTLGISEALRGKDGWCAPCLEHPVAPTPRRTASQVTYINRQPSTRPPMDHSIPMTTTSPTQPASVHNALSQHPGRIPSQGHISPPPDVASQTYVQQHPQIQQPLPQFPAPPQQDQPLYEYQQQQEIDYQQQQQQQQLQQHQEYTEFQQQPPLQHQPSPPPQQNIQYQWQQQQQPPIRINSPVYQQNAPTNMSSSAGTASPGPLQLSPLITPSTSTNNTPPCRKPVNIIYAPQATSAPPQEVLIQPVVKIKKLKRKDSSSSDSS
ncbi:hypothetical protein AJ79_06140 [Helicocarpus griseus UAMH5409]|uniref:Uncharacterized protein n=1 Tax=Helicocarpus griseus UAMH5409 TaxID=1447875 RepID=A0A2B7XGU9_9EURO|nr:hypothetical protein AJ79_06140 [Helicocarpus griseus UAMH5409]